MNKQTRNRSITSITVDGDILAHARLMGINISRTCEMALYNACGQVPPRQATLNPIEEIKKLKPPILAKLKREITIFEKTAEIGRLARCERIIKKLAKVNATLDDIKAALVDVPDVGPAAAVVIDKFCKTCKTITQHQQKRVFKSGRADKVEICQVCKTYE